MAQHAEYMESMEAAMALLTNSWQKFITAITNSETLINVIRGIGNAIDAVASGIEKLG